MTYEEAKEALKKDDPLNIRRKTALARTLHMRGDNIFLTVYIENKKYPRQNYYTIAHELGHIVLGHFFDFETTSLFNGGLTKKQYSILEREAEIFAAELIMPMPVLKSFKIKSYEDIADICKSTKSSSKIRLKEMHTFKLPNYLMPRYKTIKTIFHDFIYKKKCLECRQSFVSETAKYCPICGNNRLVRGDDKMIYNDSIKLDKNGKAYICPRCSNEETKDNSAYCKICGTNLINKCTNTKGIYEEIDFNNRVKIKDPCGKLAEGNARYCIHCGEPTTFYIQGILRDWNTKKTYPQMKQDEAKKQEEAAKQVAATIAPISDEDIPF